MDFFVQGFGLGCEALRWCFLRILIGTLSFSCCTPTPINYSLLLWVLVCYSKLDGTYNTPIMERRKKESDRKRESVRQRKEERHSKKESPPDGNDSSPGWCLSSKDWALLLPPQQRRRKGSIGSPDYPLSDIEDEGMYSFWIAPRLVCSIFLQSCQLTKGQIWIR